MSNSQNIYSENVTALFLEQPSTERDNEILKDYLDKNGHINGVKLSLTEKFYYKDYLYLKNRYADSDSFAETVYRIKNKIEEKPHCPTCGKPIKYCGAYKKHCSAKCSANDPTTREICKNTCQERYGVDNVYQSKEVIDKIKNTNIEKYGTSSYTRTEEYREKTIHANLKKYGTEYASQSQEIKDKVRNTVKEKYNVNNISQLNEVKEKKKQSSIEKYGTSCTFQGAEVLEKIKKINIEKYGVENPSSSSVIKRRKIETMKKNHTFGTSQTEEFIYKRLLEIFDKVERQYCTDEYPFQADFYIPEIKTYIEYQGTWLHGEHPYNPNSKEDQDKLKFWKSKYDEGHPYYGQAIAGWTVRDPLKRQTAKDNNLNWIEFWNLQEVENWLNQYKEKGED